MFLFLRCVGKALVSRVKEFLLDDNPLVKMGVGICGDVCRYWKEDRADDAGRRADLEQLVQAPAEEIRHEAEVIAEASFPAEARLALTAYLQQIPALIRRTLTRREDPSGKTVPASLRLEVPKDVEVFLPERLPRFCAGDRPVPGVPWVLLELLGVGGFGEVWKAHNPRFPGLIVALKFCLDAAARDHLLHHEAAVVERVLRGGKHSGIVELRQAFLEIDPPCLEYEYVDGGDLATHALQWHQGHRPFADTVQWAGRIIHTLAETVGFAHCLTPAVIHRDLKPANILLDRRKDDLRIADFGIGQIASEQALERTHRGGTCTMAPPQAILGAYTPLYASPEQIQIRGEPASPTDDVYALGVIWYQLLKGNLRLGAPTGLWWHALQTAGMAIEQIHLLGECVAAEATDRPNDAKVLADRLAPLLPSSDKPPENQGKREVVQPQTPAAVVPPIPANPKEQTSELAQPRKTRNAGAIEILDLGQNHRIDFVSVPPGTFWMGGRSSRQVKIEQGFALGQFPMTQSQWLAVMGNNPGYFSRTGGGFDDVKDISDADLWQFPVEQVSWENVEQFLAKLNEREQAGEWLYRFPSEAEWEYACRGAAGSKEECSYGFYLEKATNALSSTQANCLSTSLQRTTRVGIYAANALGFHDMHGNVFEWCNDKEGSGRVIRGGCWCSPEYNCRATTRFTRTPAFRRNWLGFRLARVRRPTQG